MRGPSIYQISQGIYYFLQQNGVVGECQTSMKQRRNRYLLRCGLNDEIDKFGLVQIAQIKLISTCFDRRIKFSVPLANKTNPGWKIIIDNTPMDQDHDDITYDEQNVYENLLNFFKANEDDCYTITTKKTVFMHIHIKTGHKKSRKMIKNELNNIKFDLGYDVYDLIGFDASGEKRIILCIERKTTIEDDMNAYCELYTFLGQNSTVLKQKKYRDLICKYIEKFENK